MHRYTCRNFQHPFHICPIFSLLMASENTPCPLFGVIMYPATYRSDFQGFCHSYSRGQCLRETHPLPYCSIHRFSEVSLSRPNYSTFYDTALRHSSYAFFMKLNKERLRLRTRPSVRPSIRLRTDISE
jgi:hypothetical protein